MKTKGTSDQHILKIRDLQFRGGENFGTALGFGDPVFCVLKKNETPLKYIFQKVKAVQVDRFSPGIFSGSCHVESWFVTTCFH